MTGRLAALAIAVALACGCSDRHLIGTVSPMGGRGGAGVGGVGGGGPAGSPGGAPGIGGVAGSPGGAPGTGGAAGSLGGAPGTGGAPLPAVRSLSGGSDSFVGLLVTSDALIVVTASGFLAYGYDDALIDQRTQPREITAAAQDGDAFVLADRAVANPFDSRSQPGTPFAIVEACSDLVMISGRRMVCGPATPFDRVFRTYDLATGTEVAYSQSYTYVGNRARRIPGRDDFVTVDIDQFPADFRLFDVGADGTAVFINDSPYHGDFPVTPTFAFDGTPARHVIQETGLMLLIDGSATSPCTRDQEGCFVKDGALGTLRGDQYFAALTEHGPGQLLGVVAPDRTATDCAQGCALQSIDISAHAAEPLGSFHPLGGGRLVTAKAAPAPLRTVYLGYAIDYPTIGYRVEAIRY